MFPELKNGKIVIKYVNTFTKKFKNLLVLNLEIDAKISTDTSSLIVVLITLRVLTEGLREV